MTIEVVPNRATQDRALIGGRWVAAQSGEFIGVHDPATNRLVASVPRGGRAEASAAVDAASGPFRLGELYLAANGLSICVVCSN